MKKERKMKTRKDSNTAIQNYKVSSLITLFLDRHIRLYGDPLIDPELPYFETVATTQLYLTAAWLSSLSAVLGSWLQVGGFLPLFCTLIPLTVLADLVTCGYVVSCVSAASLLSPALPQTGPQTRRLIVTAGSVTLLKKVPNVWALWIEKLRLMLEFTDLLKW